MFPICSNIFGERLEQNDLESAAKTLAKGYRLSAAGDPAGIICDEQGPALGPIRFLEKAAMGWAPRRAEELNAILGWTFGHPMNCERLLPGLQAIAKALNGGEIARAMIATQFLHLSPLDDRQSRRAAEAVAMLKAAADDPKHPGWPAGTPNQRGGKFRPKNGEMIQPENQDANSRSELIAEARRIATSNLERRVARRMIRQLLRTLLTWRRLARVGIEAGSNAVPILDAVGDAAMIADLVQIGNDYEKLKMERDEAIKFIQNGPYTLDQLRVDTQDRSFSSFDAFKKIDLLKFYGAAPMGRQYHHIVEQGAGGRDFPPNLIQSTRTIILVPTLLHDEITSEYMKTSPDDGPGVSIRKSLSGTPFEEQWAQGLKTLRDIGILK
jgi:hypothetical protein